MPSKKPTAGMILAAGESKRFGTPKQLIKLSKGYMLEYVIRACLASALDKVYVILGHHRREILKALAENNKSFPNNQLEFLINTQYRQGLSSSLHAGLTSIKNTFGSVMFLLGDQPLVDSVLINLMLKQYYRSDKNICVPSYKGKRGNPTIFSSKYFSLLENVTGDSGGKDIIAAHPKDILMIETDSPACVFDIDAIGDLEELSKFLM
jgi:molybdenum cofactor cytidylyltransferase